MVLVCLNLNLLSYGKNKCCYSKSGFVFFLCEFSLILEEEREIRLVEVVQKNTERIVFFGC